MNRGWMKHALVVTTAIVLVMGLSLMTGCGGKQKIEDNPADGLGSAVEELPAPPVAETTPVAPAPVTPDYGNMDPSEYGVEDIFFAFDQYELDDASMGLLAANARALREAGTTILISGHCDERGTLEYNMALGEKRANAVRDYLVSLGIPSARIRVTSYGENKPFAGGSSEDAWALNRRAHFGRP